MTVAVLRRAYEAGICVGLSAGYLVPAAIAQSSTPDISSLSLEVLSSTEITSVSRKEQKLTEAAAAVFVISSEDIRRSGLSNIAELLRTVPGLDVAEIDANKWSITSRGFGERYPDKMLVLLDGRTLYTPLTSGITWDVQETMLEDVERIEVIRGPGATLWGANAVNGVVNIITRRRRILREHWRWAVSLCRTEIPRPYGTAERSDRVVSIELLADTLTAMVPNDLARSTEPMDGTTYVAAFALTGSLGKEPL